MPRKFLVFQNFDNGDRSADVPGRSWVEGLGISLSRFLLKPVEGDWGQRVAIMTSQFDRDIDRLVPSGDSVDSGNVGGNAIGFTAFHGR